jgi:predicted 3-demethylubiquinone-9 3-methyltransferase (glyoxalase superfamily)
VNCKTQDEIDEFLENLSEGGQTEQCGWLKDKYGVSWQIVPTVLSEMMQNPEGEKSQRVMKAHLQMFTIDIETLQREYNRT